MKKRLKNYFIPHAGNDYKPHSLQKAAVMGMGLMIMLSFALANIQSAVWISSDWLVSTILPAVIVDLTNSERADDSLLGLRRSPTLDLAAKLKAEDMATKGYFAHFSPDGVSPWHWFDEAGYRYVHAGENLAVHFTDSGDVIEAWMRSPAHRANIMDGDYTEIGVGTAEGSYEGFKTVFVVQLFGTPEATASVPTTPAAVRSRAVAAAPTASAAGSATVLSETTTVTPEPVPAAVAVPSEVVPELEEGMALFSDHIATTTGGVPASTEPDVVIEPEITSGTSWFGGLITSPHRTLELLYSAIAGFVSAILILAIFIEFRRQQPVQVAYALLLLALMFGLHQVHVLLSGGAIIV